MFASLAQIILFDSAADSAKDPDEWHRFFKENFGARVTVCTCAVENDLLLHTLVERRECLRNIELLLEPGESNDELNIARKAALIERDRSFFARMLALVSKGIPEYYARMVSLSGKYHVCSLVFAWVQGIGALIFLFFTCSQSKGFGSTFVSMHQRLLDI